EIKNKLELVKLPEHEEQMIKFFLANNSDKEAKAKLQEKLINQGQWKARNPDFLSGANISVCLSDRFMAAVKNDED
ncbi:25682_t:CDS:1, partial [Racocetra persica]